MPIKPTYLHIWPTKTAPQNGNFPFKSVRPWPNFSSCLWPIYNNSWIPKETGFPVWWFLGLHRRRDPGTKAPVSKAGDRRIALRRYRWRKRWGTDDFSDLFQRLNTKIIRINEEILKILLFLCKILIFMNYFILIIKCKIFRINPLKFPPLSLLHYL